MNHTFCGDEESSNNNIISRPVKGNRLEGNHSSDFHMEDSVRRDMLVYWNDAVKKDPLAISDVLHIVTTLNIDSSPGSLQNNNLPFRLIYEVCKFLLQEFEDVLQEYLPFVVNFLPEDVRKSVGLRSVLRRLDISSPDTATSHSPSRSFLMESKRSVSRTADADFLYSNRQKVSDLFLDLMMSSSSCVNHFDAKMKRKPITFKDIYVKLDRRNMDWFADFFIEEFLKEATAGPNLNTAIRMDDRIAKLEKRMTQVSSMAVERDQLYFQFLHSFDSFSFYKAVRASCRMRLAADQSTFVRPQTFVRTCIGLVKCVSLLKQVCKLLNEGERELEEFLDDTIVDAIGTRTVCIHIWWIVKHKPKLSDELECHLKSELPGVYRVILFFLLKDYGFGLIEGLLQQKEEKVTITGPTVDSDTRNAAAMIELAKKYSNGFLDFFNYCTLGVKVRPSQLDQKQDSLQSSPPDTPSSIRKIRPVTQVSGVAFEDLQVQKSLRKWFWWMYPGLKEVIETLVAYLLDQHQECDSEDNIRGIKAKLLDCLPALTPACWTFLPEEGQARLRDLLTNLSIELLEANSFPINQPS